MNLRQGVFRNFFRKISMNDSLLLLISKCSFFEEIVVSRIAWSKSLHYLRSGCDFDDNLGEVVTFLAT